MTYEEQSKARERRLRARSRKPGESQTSADTRAAASRTTPSHFVPFDVRQATWEKEGYRSKAAKRMAQFQASSAGQEMGMGGTTDNPYGGYDTQNQSTAKPKLAPDPVGGGQTQPQTQAQPKAQSQPGGFLNRLIGAASNSPALGLVSKLAGVEDNSPQANFMRAKADGTLTDSKITEAHELARSMGTTFDPATGYSRTPFMESTRGKSYDPTAETIEGQKSKSKPTLPTPEQPSPSGNSDFADLYEKGKKGPQRVHPLQHKEWLKDQKRKRKDRKNYGTQSKMVEMNVKDYMKDFEAYMDAAAAYKKR